MRLIDADALSAKMAKYIEKNRNESDLFLNGCADGAYHYQFAVDHAQTIEERKIGKWKHVHQWTWDCSECGYRVNAKYFKYCPNCGVEMEDSIWRQTNDD